jgi:trk system potassium uptake protein TrkA
MWDRLFGRNETENEAQPRGKPKAPSRFLVIGIGQLGESLVRHLHSDGLEVIALDTDPEHIESVKAFSSLAVVGDCMEMGALEQLGAGSVDCAVLCMGTSLEATVMAIANLVELKVPHIAVRSANTKMAKIFERVGAHEVFFVEEQMGKVLAHGFSRPAILNTMELGYNLRLVEWSPADWALGKTLMELDLPSRFKIQIVALRDRNKPNEIVFPKADLRLESHFLALLVGADRDLERMQQHTGHQ